jgi:hypothetical protein
LQKDKEYPIGFCIVKTVKAERTVSAQCLQLVAGTGQSGTNRLPIKGKQRLERLWLAGSLIA